MLFTAPSFYLILLARSLSILLLLSVNQLFIVFEVRTTVFIRFCFPVSLIFAFNLLLSTFFWFILLCFYLGSWVGCLINFSSLSCFSINALKVRLPDLANENEGSPVIFEFQFKKMWGRWVVGDKVGGSFWSKGFWKDGDLETLSSLLCHLLSGK